jgi:hypothetical protein
LLLHDSQSLCSAGEKEYLRGYPNPPRLALASMPEGGDYLEENEYAHNGKDHLGIMHLNECRLR